MSPAGVLLPRETTGLAERLARSQAAVDPASGALRATEDARAWLEERRRASRARVRRIPFDELQGWSFHPETGDLVHRSGRFFTVEGLRVPPGEATGGGWEQPVLMQPEIGLLGLLAKEFDGVLHFLLHAKMEPGNRGVLQLSPTVQATRSNYQRVHGGRPVKYLDHFVQPGRARPLTDTLQSEHGEWFLHKSNRNVVVETDEDLPADDGGEPDYRWLTLGQLGTLLREDHVVNMDTRTVLACLPVSHHGTRARHSDVEVWAWLSGERSRLRLRPVSVPLAGVRGWVREEHAIRREDDRAFRVVAAAVETEGREVGGWTQPLFEPCARGLSVFLHREIDGVPHLLAHTRTEGGLLHSVEVGPTVRYVPDGSEPRPPFADLVEGADASRVRYATVHSEEGGRFLHAENLCMFVSTDGLDEPELTDPPAGYAWITADQLGMLVRAGSHVEIQARSLLSLLNSGAVKLP